MELSSSGALTRFKLFIDRFAMPRGRSSSPLPPPQLPTEGLPLFDRADESSAREEADARKEGGDAHADAS
jgi:hypothetical protein